MQKKLEKNDFFESSQIDARRFRVRVYLIVLLVMLSMAMLGWRLFYLQSIDNERYATLSKENHVRVVPIPPVRGLIYDRNLRLLANNKPSYQIQVTPSQVDDLKQVIADIGKYVQLEDYHLTKFYESARRKQTFEPVPLKINVSDEDVARFAVNRHRFPGVEIAALVGRNYPLAEVGVHALGYMGQIDTREVKTLDKSDYNGTTHIGKSGVEKFYEEVLHGDVGYRHVEINAQGRILRTLETVFPTPGADLILSLDARLQKIAQEILGERKGSVVAMDPRSGEILVFVSTPAFNPALFVNGVSSKQYASLNNDPGRPLFNRALMGQYMPGSTIKPMLALAGLNYEAISPQKIINAGPFYQLPGYKRKYRDWKKEGHGKVDMRKAITQSCDVYFYTLANELGIDRIAEFLTQFNFGVKTEVDVWGEATGVIPTPEWKRSVYGQPWHPGETVIAGIGQGYMLVTPLQLAVATSVLATRGQVVKPRFLRAIRKRDGTMETDTTGAVAISSVTVSNEEYWQEIISGMVDSVHRPNGTAYRIGRNADYKIAGKTGTAQVFSLNGGEYDETKLAKELWDHGLFIAFAPVDDPKIAIAVIVENGGSGGKVAAPIAKTIMDHYLLDEETLPVVAGLL